VGAASSRDDALMAKKANFFAAESRSHKKPMKVNEISTDFV
jgi:hypothetical protein